RSLRPRIAPVELDDVAELALERTAARVLHAHRGVARTGEEIEPRRPRQRHVGLRVAGRREKMRPLAPLERTDERLQTPLGLAGEHVVRVRELFRPGA